MLNTNQKPAKPPIAVKPKNIQKTNYVVIAQDHSTPSNINIHNNNNNNNNNRTLPTPNRNTRNVHVEQLPFVTNKDVNHFSLPSSSLLHQHYQQQQYMHQHYRLGECTNDFVNKQQQMEYNMHSNLNRNNGTYTTNGAAEMENDYYRDVNDADMVDFKSFHTPSHSFDSSSSSSGGFKDIDFISKTKAVYEMYDKDDKNSHNESYQMPNAIGHSKVQEIQSKLFAAQQQLQQAHQNHLSNEHSIAVNRQQYQKSSKELEKLLSMRVGHEKKMQAIHANQDKPPVRKLSKGCEEQDDEHGIVNLTSQLALNISKQIQQKLQQEMKQQCDIIKEKFLIEKIPVQQHYRDYVVKTISCLFPSFRFHLYFGFSL